MTNFSRSFRGRAGTASPRVAAIAAVLLACALPPALARPSDALHVYGALGYLHDDNLFRLPDDSRLSDSAAYATYGLFFDRTYSRQKVFAQAKWSKVKFSRFSQLDYDGKDFLGLWNWQVGNQVEGSLGASYEQTLAPYTDLRTRERNLRVHKRQHADAAWKLHPSYRLRVGASRDTYRYDLAIQRFNNRSEDMLEAGIDFTPRSGSTAGLVLRRLKGRYQTIRVLGGAPINDDFSQDEVKAKVNWKVTEITSIQMLAGYARRRHAVLGPRDASGLNGRVTASLNPRKKLRVNAALWREFAPIESNLVTYSLNHGASAGASWDAAAKVRVDAALSRERRRFEGSPLLLSTGELSDTLHQGSLSATWSIRPTVQITGGYVHQRRRGDAFLGNGSFTSNLFSVQANAQF